MFAQRLPARQFRKYVCTGRAALASTRRNGSLAGSGSEDGDKREHKDGTVETIERVFGNEKGVVAAAETAVYVA